MSLNYTCQSTSRHLEGMDRTDFKIFTRQPTLEHELDEMSQVIEKEFCVGNNGGRGEILCWQ